MGKSKLFIFLNNKSRKDLKIVEFNGQGRYNFFITSFQAFFKTIVKLLSLLMSYSVLSNSRFKTPYYYYRLDSYLLHQFVFNLTNLRFELPAKLSVIRSERKTISLSQITNYDFPALHIATKSH